MSLQHWTKLVTTGKMPPTRSNHATCCIAGPATGQHHPILMVVGGRSDNSKMLCDVWLLDVDQRLWSEVGAVASDCVASNL